MAKILASLHPLRSYWALSRLYLPVASQYHKFGPVQLSQYCWQLEANVHHKMDFYFLQGSPHAKATLLKFIHFTYRKRRIYWKHSILKKLSFIKAAGCSVMSCVLQVQTSLYISFEGCLGGNRNPMMNIIKQVHLAIKWCYYHYYITHFTLKFMFTFKTNNPFRLLVSKQPTYFMFKVTCHTPTSEINTKSIYLLPLSPTLKANVKCYKAPQWCQ